MNKIFENFKLYRFVNVTTDSVSSFIARGRPYLDITYCIKGELEYEFNGERFVALGGDVVVFPPNTMRLRHAGSVPTHYVSFNVVLPENFEVEGSGHFKKCITPDTVYMIELFDKIWRSASPRRTEQCSGIFYYLYNALMEMIVNVENPHVNLIKQYVIDNISSKITTADIAEKVHLAPQYVCAIFKKHTGLTISEFIEGERIDLAKRLMIISDMPLYAIAEKCGFSDYNYFSSVFRKIEGSSAREYRKAIIKK